MMKVNNLTLRKDLNEMAKGFNLKFVGVSTDNLVEAINNKIEALLNGSEEVVALTENQKEYMVPDGVEIVAASNDAPEDNEPSDNKEEDDKGEGETPEATKKELKTLADFGLVAGEVVQIIGEGLPGRSKNLDGRKAEVVGISRRGFVRVVLLNKEGQKQNCTCPMPAVNLKKVIEEVKAEESEGAVA